MGLFKDDPTQRGLNPDGSEKLSLDVNQPDVPAAYQGLLDANPYMNVDYKQSNWQRFLSNLGFRTGYDKRKEDMQLQANEWNANVASLAFENQFNSDAAKSGRMRAAGLNPDLLGTGDSANSAGMAEDTNPPAPTETDAQSVSQFANVIMSAFSMATGFAKDIGTLRSLSLANQNQEIANVEGVVNGAQNFLLKHLPADMPTSDEDWGNNAVEISSILESAYKPHMSKRAYRRFSNAVSGMFDKLPHEAEAYKTYLDKIRNKQEAHILGQSEYYDEQEEVLRDLVLPLVELNDRTIKATSTAQAVHAENTESYESASQALGVPEEAAGVESAGYEQKTQEFNMQRELRSTLSKIIHNLKKRADSGGRGSGFADTMLLTLSVLSMMSFQSGSSTSNGPKGITETSSTSVGF